MQTSPSRAKISTDRCRSWIRLRQDLRMAMNLYQRRVDPAHVADAPSPRARPRTRSLGDPGRLPAAGRQPLRDDARTVPRTPLSPLSPPRLGDAPRAPVLQPRDAAPRHRRPRLPDPRPGTGGASRINGSRSVSWGARWPRRHAHAHVPRARRLDLRPGRAPRVLSAGCPGLDPGQPRLCRAARLRDGRRHGQL